MNEQDIHSCLRCASVAALALAGALAPAAPAIAQDSADPEVEVVTVTGQRLAQKRALERKRLSDAILDAVSSDEIGRLPNRNSAEAIESLPGVSLSYDQGEGRFVSIRGASPNLNNVTINGITAGTPEGDGRTVPLDVIGGELLSSIEVIKAVTPDMDAQSIGGTVNVIPPSPFDYEGGFAAGSARGGYEEKGGNTPYAANVTAGNRFGADDEWGYLIGGSYSLRDFESNGIFPDDWIINDAGGAQPEGFKHNYYEIERTRIGFTGALEYQPEVGRHYFLRALYSDFQEDENRQRIEYGNLAEGAVFDAPQRGSTSNAEGESELRYEEKDKLFLNVSTGGENRIELWTIEHSLSYINTETDEPNENWEFRGDGLDVAFDTGPFLPDVEPGANAADPDSYAFARYREQLDLIEEDSWVAALDFRRDDLFGALPGFLKLGAKFRTTDKKQDIETPRWEDGETSFTLASADLTRPPIRNNVDGKIYSLGPIMDLGRIREYTAANIDDPALFAFDEGATLEDGVLEDYDLTEEVLAGYVMASVDIDRLTVLGGVRVERTETDADGFELTNGQEVSPVSNSGSYTNVLPGLHLRYRATDDVLLRAAWTNTIGRPSYGDISPTREFEIDEPSPGVFEGELSEGNPELDPYESMNLDLSAEYYFSELGIVSAAVFYKDIENPIFGDSVTLENVTFEGQDFRELEISRPANADSGEILGVELAYQQEFTFLPEPFDGLGFSGSLTLVDSELTVPGREDEDLPFLGQSDTIYSLALSYQKGRFDAVLAYDFASSYLDGLEGDPTTDIYYNDFGRLDARVSYQLNDNLGIFAEFENLNDEPGHEYQGGNKNWVTGYELYDYTAYVGITGRW